MDGRKRLSGAEYKRLRKEKTDKLEDVIPKTRKLDSFFKSNRASTSASGSEEKQGSSATVTSHNLEVVNLEGMFLAEINRPSVSSIQPSEMPVLDILVQVPKESTSEIITDETDVDTADIMVSNDPFEWINNDFTINYLLSNGIIRI